MKIQTINYTFDKAAKTVIFTDYASINLESIYAIINVTRNVLIYRPDVAALNGTASTNVLTLTFDTSTHSNTDKLLIIYDSRAKLFADTTANPVSDFIGSFLHIFNGSTWDRLRGDITNGLDVDVTRQPALARATDTIAAVDTTDAIMSGTTALTPKFAQINRVTNADGAAVVAIVSGKKIRVVKLFLMAAGSVSVKFQSSTSDSSGAGSNTDLMPAVALTGQTGWSDSYTPVGLFETASGQSLKLNCSANVQVSGYLTYVEA